MKPNLSAAAAFFANALVYTESSPTLREEVAWQRTRSLDSLTESDFLRETAWVILCSGFKEAVVRRWFSYISLCFCDWLSANEIVRTDPACINAARNAIDHEQKMHAIVVTARLVVEHGFDAYKKRLEEQGVAELRRIPYIGPITSWHLAKNIGIQTSKPDRHLTRLAEHFGFNDVTQLCGSLSDVTGEPVSVVDLVLWRFMADSPLRVTAA